MVRGERPQAELPRRRRASRARSRAGRRRARPCRRARARRRSAAGRPAQPGRARAGRTRARARPIGDEPALGVARDDAARAGRAGRSPPGPEPSASRASPMHQATSGCHGHDAERRDVGPHREVDVALLAADDRRVAEVGRHDRRAEGDALLGEMLELRDRDVLAARDPVQVGVEEPDGADASLLQRADVLAGHATTRTGSRLTPLKKFERSRSGAPGRLDPVEVRQHLLEPDSDLQRARCAPRQKCGPPRPKVRCRFGCAGHVETIRIGELPLVEVARRVPDRRPCLRRRSSAREPRSSRVAVRRKWCTGCAQRRISSAAVRGERRVGDEPRALCRDARRAPARPRLIVCRVVSLPAVVSRMKNVSNSSGVEPLAVDLRLDEPRRDVVARLAAAGLAELAAVGHQVERVGARERQLAQLRRRAARPRRTARLAHHLRVGVPEQLVAEVDQEAAILDAAGP